jgi:DNA repair exonuclease SbcCD nuclease subunit
MSKICILTDTHFGARNDSLHYDAYFKRFYHDVFFPYIDRTQIKTILHLGDVFDRRKYINFSTLRSCKEYFFKQLQERDIDMKVILGNHDTYYKNTNEVNSLDLLLREYTNIEIIEHPVVTNINGITAAFIPWMCADNLEKCLDVIKIPADICFGHFEIAGFDMFRGTKNIEGMDRGILKQYSKVLTGHFHHRSTDDNIYYLGSPYGFTWNDYGDARGFHVFDTSTLDLEFIENPFEMFHKIYYDDRKKEIDPTKFANSCVKVIVVHKQDYLKFDKFIESLYTNEVLELTIHEDFSDFEASILENENDNIEDTLTMLTNYVDSIQSTKDKERLKTLLKILYIEAQTLEV